MKSPFPGMDPYIEACKLWEDFHGHLIENVSERLADALPERYVVRSGERAYLEVVEEEEIRRHPFLPDVRVSARRNRQKSGKRNGGAAVAERGSAIEPSIMRAFIKEEHREGFVEIIEVDAATAEHRLVTCVEVLSPSNKRSGSEGWNIYQRKRQSLLLGGVNLVEIDLLRGGQRMPMMDPWPESPYALLVARAYKEYACWVWPASFQQPLPAIPVPLANPDPAVSLNLQPMIETIYRRFRYERSIDYGKPLKPPLDADDAAWLQKRLRARKNPA
jgi:hypothetical protein